MPDETIPNPPQDSEEDALKRLVGQLNKTFAFAGEVGGPVLGNGFFATVHDIGNGIGVAVGTDGVGTKLLVAEALHRYDTVGIDCIAMNANDVLCVGARPFSLVDYLAVQEVHGDIMEALGRGLYEGARQAGVAIAGGELATIPEMLQGVRPGGGFDLMATCLGLVQVADIIDGRAIRDGDVVIGLASSGLHSNGYTLARKVLLADAELPLAGYIDELGCTLGEELLKPTKIYVMPILEALQQTKGIAGMAHITGGGYLNILRLRTDCGFELTTLPAPPRIFGLIQRLGKLTPEEMYRTFNMGVGFVAVARPDAAAIVLASAARHGFAAQVIGRTRSSLKGKIVLTQLGLVGEGHGFRAVLG